MSDLASELFPFPPAPGFEALEQLARTNPIIYELYRKHRLGQLDKEHFMVACVLALAEESDRLRDELNLLISITKSRGDLGLLGRESPNGD